MSREHCLKPDVCEAKGRGTHCRTCAFTVLQSDPAIQERRLAGARASAKEQVMRDRRSAAMKKVAEGHKKDPRIMKMRRELGRSLGKRFGGNGRSEEAIAAGAAKSRAAMLAWCPEEYWPLNAQLKRKRLTLEERQQVIRDLVLSKDPAEIERRAARARIAEIDAQQRARAAREQEQAY